MTIEEKSEKVRELLSLLHREDVFDYVEAKDKDTLKVWKQIGEKKADGYDQVAIETFREIPGAFLSSVLVSGIYSESLLEKMEKLDVVHYEALATMKTFLDRAIPRAILEKNYFTVEELMSAAYEAFEVNQMLAIYERAKEKLSE